MAAKQDKRLFDEVLECPLTRERFVDPVIADDGHTYERSAIIQWLRGASTSPMTRQSMSLDSLRPNYLVKQILEIEHQSARQNYKFKLNVDVKKKGNRPLFQNGGKFLYEAQWLNNLQGPDIVLLHIRGARALKEASFYVQLSRHRNILRTFGFVETNDEPSGGIMLLQEYAPMGDLAETLLNAPLPPSDQRVFSEIFIQIADAMSYLAQKHIVHGDLACQNILVFQFDPKESNRNLVKLTDFGLTRESALYQTTSNATSTMCIFPLRWSAPEILQKPNDRGSYTEKSDMYSMGVLMWQALSKGGLPWDELEDDQIRTKVLGSERLKRPSTRVCTDALWSIILKCMTHQSDHRPTFTELQSEILHLLPDRTSSNIRLTNLYLQSIRPSTASSMHR